VFNHGVSGIRNVDRIAEQLAGRALTYPELGATRARLPSGYRHVRAVALLGQGPRVFGQAADFICSWSMHRDAGLHVVATGDRANEGVDALLKLPIGPVRVSAPVRVVYEILEPDRRGFAYGTLDGHPESGEEAFLVTIDQRGSVSFEVVGFSKPVWTVARCGGPITRFAQDRVIKRYTMAVLRSAQSHESDGGRDDRTQ
jgi:uncharacterized protein (UPF0548 family)